MDPIEFLKTIYLGDRGCKRLVIDGWKECVELQVDSISRVRGPSGLWNYYTDEDVDDGLLVFTQVSSIKLYPSGPVPNDSINSFDAHPVEGDNIDASKRRYVFELSITSADSTGATCEVEIEIIAEGVHLENPIYPGVLVP